MREYVCKLQYYFTHKKMAHNNSRERLRKKLSSVHPREAPFDINPDNLTLLGDAILRCVSNNIELRPYSSLTFKHPTIPLTEIPELPSLFQQACLHYGLLGYLDWINENNPSEVNTIITNNVIIITCGTTIFNSSTDIIDPDKHNNPTNDEKLSSASSIPEIVHDINQRKLEVLRNMSRQKFNSMIGTL